MSTTKILISIQTLNYHLLAARGWINVIVKGTEFTLICHLISMGFSVPFYSISTRVCDLNLCVIFKSKQLVRDKTSILLFYDQVEYFWFYDLLRLTAFLLSNESYPSPPQKKTKKISVTPIHTTYYKLQVLKRHSLDTKIEAVETLQLLFILSSFI